jgi:hypothetical protein
MSHYFFDPGDTPPVEVAGYLLRRNHELGIGGWSLSVTSRSAGLALSYTALGAGLDAAMLKVICEAMVKEASALDDKLRQAGVL